MPARKSRDPNDKPQIEKYREAARELGCDDDEATFEEKLRQIMKAKPQPKSEFGKQRPGG
jgi:hypothetical protein